MWRLNNMFLNTHGSKKKSKWKSNNILKQMNMESQHSKTYGMQQKCSKRKVYSNKRLH